MIHFFLVLLLLISVSPAAYSQKEPDEVIKARADKLFEDEKYVECTSLYLNLLANSPRSHEYNYKYGTCLLFNSYKKQDAFKYLTYAVQNPETDIEAYYFLGKAYHLNYQFNEGIKNYQIYKQKAGGKPKPAFLVDRQIEMCENGKRLLSNITDMVVMEKKEIDIAKFFRLYDLSNIGGDVLVAADFQSKVDKKKGHVPLIHFPAKSNIVYYASYGESDEGQKDIYFRTKTDGAAWGPPQKVPGNVNTKFDDDFPYMHPSGQYLYFCSKGHNSMGGYDVFRSKLNKGTGEFGTPENMDFAISSPDNDFFYVVDSMDNNAYFASARQSSNGKLYVYKVRVDRLPLQLAVIKGSFSSAINPANKKIVIQVNDYANGEKIGVFPTNDKGNYLITFPKGGKYSYEIRVEGSPETFKYVVSIPFQKEFKPLKQRISHERVSVNEVVKVFDLFDEGFTDDELAGIIADRAKIMSDLNPNAKDIDLNSVSTGDFSKLYAELGFPKNAAPSQILSVFETMEKTQTEEIDASENFINGAMTSGLDKLDLVEKLNIEAKNLVTRANAAKNIEAKYDLLLEAQAKLVLAEKLKVDVNGLLSFADSVQKTLPEDKEKLSAISAITKEVRKEVMANNQAGLTEIITANKTLIKNVRDEDKTNPVDKLINQKMEKTDERKKLAAQESRYSRSAAEMEQLIEALKVTLSEAKKKDAPEIQSKIDAKTTELGMVKEEKERLTRKIIAISEIERSLDDRIAFLQNVVKVKDSTEVAPAEVKEKLAQVVAKTNKSLNELIAQQLAEMKKNPELQAIMATKDADPEVTERKKVRDTRIAAINASKEPPKYKVEQRLAEENEFFQFLESALSKLNAELAKTPSDDKLLSRKATIVKLKLETTANIADEQKDLAILNGQEDNNPKRLGRNLALKHGDLVWKASLTNGTEAQKAEQLVAIYKKSLAEIEDALMKNTVILTSTPNDQEALRDREILLKLKEEILRELAEQERILKGGSGEVDPVVAELERTYKEALNRVETANLAEFEKQQALLKVEEEYVAAINIEIAGADRLIAKNAADEKAKLRKNTLESVKKSSQVRAEGIKKAIKAASTTEVTKADPTGNPDLVEDRVSKLQKMDAENKATLLKIQTGFGTDIEKLQKAISQNEQFKGQLDVEQQNVNKILTANSSDVNAKTAKAMLTTLTEATLQRIQKDQTTLADLQATKTNTKNDVTIDAGNNEFVARLKQKEAENNKVLERIKIGTGTELEKLQKANAQHEIFLDALDVEQVAINKVLSTDPNNVIAKTAKVMLTSLKESARQQIYTNQAAIIKIQSTNGSSPRIKALAFIQALEQQFAEDLAKIDETTTTIEDRLTQRISKHREHLQVVESELTKNAAVLKKDPTNQEAQELRDGLILLKRKIEKSLEADQAALTNSMKVDSDVAESTKTVITFDKKYKSKTRPEIELMGQQIEKQLLDLELGTLPIAEKLQAQINKEQGFINSLATEKKVIEGELREEPAVEQLLDSKKAIEELSSKTSVSLENRRNQLNALNKGYIEYDPLVLEIRQRLSDRKKAVMGQLDLTAREREAKILVIEQEILDEVEENIKKITAAGSTSAKVRILKELNELKEEIIRSMEAREALIIELDDIPADLATDVNKAMKKYRPNYADAIAGVGGKNAAARIEERNDIDKGIREKIAIDLEALSGNLARNPNDEALKRQQNALNALDVQLDKQIRERSKTEEKVDEKPLALIDAMERELRRIAPTYRANAAEYVGKTDLNSLTILNKMDNDVLNLITKELIQLMRDEISNGKSVFLANRKLGLEGLATKFAEQVEAQRKALIAIKAKQPDVAQLLNDLKNIDTKYQNPSLTLPPMISAQEAIEKELQRIAPKYKQEAAKYTDKKDLSSLEAKNKLDNDVLTKANSEMAVISQTSTLNGSPTQLLERKLGLEGIDNRFKQQIDEQNKAIAALKNGSSDTKTNPVSNAMMSQKDAMDRELTRIAPQYKQKITLYTDNNSTTDLNARTKLNVEVLEKSKKELTVVMQSINSGENNSENTRELLERKLGLEGINTQFAAQIETDKKQLERLKREPTLDTDNLAAKKGMISQSEAIDRELNRIAPQYKQKVSLYTDNNSTTDLNARTKLNVDVLEKSKSELTAVIQSIDATGNNAANNRELLERKLGLEGINTQFAEQLEKDRIQLERLKREPTLDSDNLGDKKGTLSQSEAIERELNRIAPQYKQKITLYSDNKSTTDLEARTKLNNEVLDKSKKELVLVLQAINTSGSTRELLERKLGLEGINTQLTQQIETDKKALETLKKDAVVDVNDLVDDTPTISQSEAIEKELKRIAPTYKQNAAKYTDNTSIESLQAKNKLDKELVDLANKELMATMQSINISGSNRELLERKLGLEGIVNQYTKQIDSQKKAIETLKASIVSIPDLAAEELKRIAPTYKQDFAAIKGTGKVNDRARNTLDNTVLDKINKEQTTVAAAIKKTPTDKKLIAKDDALTFLKEQFKQQIAGRGDVTEPKVVGDLSDRAEKVLRQIVPTYDADMAAAKKGTVNETLIAENKVDQLARAKVRAVQNTVDAELKKNPNNTQQKDLKLVLNGIQNKLASNVDDRNARIQSGDAGAPAVTQATLQQLLTELAPNYKKDFAVIKGETPLAKRQRNTLDQTVLDKIGAERKKVKLAMDKTPADKNLKFRNAALLKLEDQFKAQISARGNTSDEPVAETMDQKVDKMLRQVVPTYDADMSKAVSNDEATRLSLENKVDQAARLKVKTARETSQAALKKDPTNAQQKERNNVLAAVVTRLDNQISEREVQVKELNAIPDVTSASMQQVLAEIAPNYSKDMSVIKGDNVEAKRSRNKIDSEVVTKIAAEKAKVTAVIAKNPTDKNAKFRSAVLLKLEEQFNAQIKARGTLADKAVSDDMAVKANKALRQVVPTYDEEIRNAAKGNKRETFLAENKVDEAAAVRVKAAQTNTDQSLAKDPNNAVQKERKVVLAAVQTLLSDQIKDRIAEADKMVNDIAVAPGTMQGLMTELTPNYKSDMRNAANSPTLQETVAAKIGIDQTLLNKIEAELSKTQAALAKNPQDQAAVQRNLALTVLATRVRNQIASRERFITAYKGDASIIEAAARIELLDMSPTYDTEIARAVGATQKQGLLAKNVIDAKLMKQAENELESFEDELIQMPTSERTQMRRDGLELLSFQLRDNQYKRTKEMEAITEASTDTDLLRAIAKAIRPAYLPNKDNISSNFPAGVKRNDALVREERAFLADIKRESAKIEAKLLKTPSDKTLLASAAQFRQAMSMQQEIVSDQEAALITALKKAINVKQLLNSLVPGYTVPDMKRERKEADKKMLADKEIALTTAIEKRILANNRLQEKSFDPQKLAENELLGELKIESENRKLALLNPIEKLAMDAIMAELGADAKRLMQSKPKTIEEAKEMLITLKRYDDALRAKIVERKGADVYDEKLLNVQIAQQKIVRRRIPVIEFDLEAMMASAKIEKSGSSADRDVYRIEQVEKAINEQIALADSEREKKKLEDELEKLEEEKRAAALLAEQIKDAENKAKKEEETAKLTTKNPESDLAKEITKITEKITAKPTIEVEPVGSEKDKTAEKERKEEVAISLLNSTNSFLEADKLFTEEGIVIETLENIRAKIRRFSIEIGQLEAVMQTFPDDKDKQAELGKQKDVLEATIKRLREMEAKLLEEQKEAQPLADGSMDVSVSFDEEVKLASSENYAKMITVDRRIRDLRIELAQVLQNKKVTRGKFAVATTEEEKVTLRNKLKELIARETEIRRLLGEDESLLNELIYKEGGDSMKWKNLLSRDVVPVAATTIATVSTVLAPLLAGGFEIKETRDTISKRAELAIPVDLEMPKGLVYRVQVGAFAKQLPENIFTEFSPVTGEKLKNGITRYMAGFFDSRGKSTDAQKQIRGLGYGDAFIVAYCDGQRVSLDQARRLEESGQCVPQRQEAMIQNIVDNTQAKLPRNTIDDTIKKRVITAIPKLADYNKAPGAAPAQAVEERLGLFYTVQVGVYNKPVGPEQVKNIAPLVTKRLDNGQLRYSAGIFQSVENAIPKKEEAVARGIVDAFVTAYYKGERISLPEAERLLAEKGKAILEAKGVTTVSPNAVEEAKQYVAAQPKVKSDPFKGQPVQIVSKDRFPEYPRDVLNRYNAYGSFYYDENDKRVKSVKYNSVDEIPQMYYLRDAIDTVVVVPKVVEEVDDFTAVSVKNVAVIAQFSGEKMSGEMADWLLRFTLPRQGKLNDKGFVLRFEDVSEDVRTNLVDRLRFYGALDVRVE